MHGKHTPQVPLLFPFFPPVFKVVVSFRGTTLARLHHAAGDHLGSEVYSATILIEPEGSKGTPDECCASRYPG